MLIDSSVSRLPPFLTADAGLNSGFMIAHVTAAALASENKSLAHPASVDSLPTSANQEDHVSMATFAARRLQSMIHNTAHILGIELLAAAQGIEFLRPLREHLDRPCVLEVCLNQPGELQIELASGWQAVAAPKGLPADLRTKLHEAVVAGLNDPAIKAKLLELGFELVLNTPEQFASYQAAEYVRWQKLISARNIKAD